MTAQWAGVGAETDPLRRARQLQRSWERLLADGALAPELPPEATAGLRPTIIESWRRSLATGLDPTDVLAPIEADESEVLGRWFDHPLGSLTHLLTEQLRKLAEESQGMVVVTDASGLVLHRIGDERLKERAAEMNLVEGARYSEAADGTNGIGTALAADHAFQVFAFEHFNERHHEWVCAGAPVHDPVSGQTVGLIDLSTLWRIAHPRSLELVTNAARAIEQCLADARHDRNARLRRRYSDLMTKSTDLLVDRDGYVLDDAAPANPGPLDIPDGGGEVVVADGSVAIATPLGRGEAYLLRRGATRRAKFTPRVKGLERAEARARELATEQAALRQVATLVARESSPDQLFAVVAEQVARILNVPYVRLVLFEPDGSFVVGGFSEGEDEPFPIGSRWPLDSPGVTATVRQTGRPARLENYEDVTGEIAAVARGAGMHSAVACPIVVERRLWGAMVVLSPQDDPLPNDTEARLTDFTELVATAIGNAESRQALAELADEQAALRRVATLVARGVQPDEVCLAVSREVGRLFGTELAAVGRFEPDGRALDVVGAGRMHERWELADFLPATEVFRTGRSARADAARWESAEGETAERLRSLGIVSMAASPIVVEDELWGVMTLADTNQSLPPDTEERLEKFTEIVASAIANAEARAEVERLAEEQAGLRRVATFVAQEASQAKVFDAIASEAMQLLRTDAVRIVRYDGESGVVLAGSGQPEVTPPGFRFPLAGETVAARIFRQGEPARQDDYSFGGPIAESVRASGIRSVVGVPVFVEGRLWGAITTGMTREEPLPPDTESRLGEFTALIATAISNAEARAEVARLADEQAALRRVATLVARDVPSEEIFSAVSDEVSRLVGSDMAVVLRFEDDERPAIVFVGVSNADVVSRGTRWELEEGMTAAKVFRTGRSARSHVAELRSGPAAETAARLGILSTVASPITVGGRLWGAVVASSTEELPLDTEDRVKKFTELVATAISNAESREARSVLTEEQAALRRVATLVASGITPEEVFQAVAAEVGVLFGSDTGAIVRFEDDRTVTVLGAVSGPHETGKRVTLDPGSAVDVVRETRRSARFDTDDPSAPDMPSIVQALGIRSAVASPIVVQGELWGALTTASVEGPLPLDAERRLTEFTELVATAVANTQAREEVTLLADEQAALRRVAVLVAQEPSPSEVFTAVTEAVGLLLDADLAVLHVFPGDGTATTVANWGAEGQTLPVGSRFPLDGDNLAARIFASGAPARMHSDEEAWQRAATNLARNLRVRSAVGAPILVEGKLWGVLMAGTCGVEPWAENAETRLAAFTELVATAVANAQSREALAELANEQAALRRVATLVARGAQPNEVFWAVSDEVGRLFGTQFAAVGRFEPNGRLLALVGADRTEEQWELADFMATAEVLRTGRSARAEAARWESEEGQAADRLRSLGIVSTVASPIVVEGELWGAMLVASTNELLPSDTEERLEKFTEVVATAIANAESREARAVLTEEQAALRRVATLVAQGTSPQDLFEAVAEEVGRLLPVGSATMGRFEPDDSVTTVASWSTTEAAFPTGRRWPTEGTNVAWMVLQTGREARLDDFSAATDPIGVAAREAGIKSAVGSPIVVDGHLWGVVSATSSEGPLPPDTEARLASFTELVATAIANAESSAELAASRRRIVAASDDARRRIERDLHDGVQQQLVSLALELGAMKAEPPTGDVLERRLASVTEDVGSVLDALVETARGIHPAILSQGGLAAALKALARRSAVPVELQAQIEGPLPDEVEVAAYYVAAEALTNAAKHARASVVHMHATTDDGTLTLIVRDDGVGGADPGGGSGLVGLQDRVEALGGTIKIDSSATTGTCVVVTLPIATEPNQELENLLPPQELESPTSPA